MGQAYRALIDTGASRSYIGKTIIANLRERKIRPRVTPNRKLIPANGTHTDVEGECFLNISIGGKVENIPVRWVTELSEHCILGIDAIKQFGITINGRKSTWEIDDERQGGQTQQKQALEITAHNITQTPEQLKVKRDELRTQKPCEPTEELKKRATTELETRKGTKANKTKPTREQVPQTNTATPQTQKAQTHTQHHDTTANTNQTLG